MSAEPRVFGRQWNGIVRGVVVGVPLMLLLAGWVAWGVENSSYVSGRGIPVEQPVPFSHEHHVGGLGIDCRYCHTSAADSAFAGVPPTKTCMTCHSQIWTNAPMLEPVRQSWRIGRPIQWRRVNRLPGYVYFDHSIHVSKGVGCVTCHGRVDDMPLTSQAASLQMAWCLDCHRHPEPNLRPRDQVFTMNRDPAISGGASRDWVTRYEVRPAAALTDCSTCHS
jgi:hypothetical protein